MKIIEQYNIAGKIFNNKEDALDYENKLRNNLELRARNLKLFYWKMMGYPGEHTAINLINNFCHHHKFTFGKWKGKCVGEIMVIFPEYIKWCVENVSFFKMNKEEEALYNTSWGRYLGGTSWNITEDEVTYIPSERPDYKLIEWEEQQHETKS